MTSQGRFLNMAPGTIGIGVSAGALASATGGCFIGYGAGKSVTTGVGNVVIGASSDVVDTNMGQSVCVGYNCTMSQGSASSGCVAIGRKASCYSYNSIVLGKQPQSATALGPRVIEHGKHQQFWKWYGTATASVSWTGANATYVCGGWISFAGAAGSPLTLTLPTFAELSAIMPNKYDGLTGEFLVSNMDTGQTVTIAGGTNVNVYYEGPMPDNSMAHVYWRYDTTGTTRFDFFV
jgi:hypothetical protein